MEGSTPPGRRTLTPAVLGSALFVAVCAVFAITFVAARGGLQMPIAPSGSTAAFASVAPSTEAPSPGVPTSAPTTSPPATSGPTPPPPSATPSAPPTESPDPLAALPGCPGLPDCYQYLIQRNDTLSRIAARYSIPVPIVLTLNPEITDPSVIVVGHILYLGRVPYARLESCGPSCYLYEVQPGDRLATIAARYDTTIEAILEENPTIDDQNTIYSGQLLRLQYAPG